MPAYLYSADDGRIEEFVFSISSRPDSFTDSDGTTWTFDFGATVKTQHFPSPGMEFVTDSLAAQIHPSQCDDYNRTARAIGISGADAQWDERGTLHASRTGMKKLVDAMGKARQRANDPEFRPPPGVTPPKRKVTANE